MDMKGYTWQLPLSDCYPITVLGIGTAGLAVVKHLFCLAMRDARFIVCHADEAQIRASPVSIRLLYDADDAEAEKNLLDEFKQVLPASELIIIVTDLSQPIDCQLASIAVSACTELGKFVIAAIGLSILSGQLLPDQVDNVLASLQHQVHSLLIYEQGHVASEQRGYQLAEGVANLITFCESFTSEDFADMRKVVTRPGRIAVAVGIGNSVNRSKIVLDAVAAQLNEQPFDARFAQRLLLISATSSEDALMVPEHTALMNDMLSFMIHEPAIVKQGIILDNSLGDKLRLSSLFWMPIELPQVLLGG